MITMSHHQNHFHEKGSLCASKNTMLEDLSFRQQRRDFLAGGGAAAAAALSFLFVSPSLALADDDNDDDDDEDAPKATTVHKIDYPIAGKCGEASVPEKVAPLVKTFGGFKDGACKVDGFATADGTANGTGEKDKERTYSIFSQ